MNEVIAARMLGATDRFISKVKRQNEPFQAFLKTADYEKLYDAIKSAVRNQAKTVSQALKDLDTSSSLVMNDDKEPLNASNIAHLRQFIRDTMPGMQDLIGQELVAHCLTAAFTYSVKAQYKRWGLIVKADVQFQLKNQKYIDMLDDQANYLLNNSSIDDTTLEQMITLIRDGKEEGMTIDEVADELSDTFDDVSDNRAFVIARTETAQAMGSANLATMQENGVATKHWVTAGANICPTCEGNADQGSISVNDSFSSGDDSEPAHPNCECYTEADEIDLDSIDIWDGE